MIIKSTTEMSQKAKIKVCHITTVHKPFDDRIFHRECKTLSKLGYDVSVIAYHERDETVDDVRIIALPKAKNRIHRILIITLKAFRLATKQKADIYHFHDPELLLVGILLKLLSRKKVIYDVHEDYSKQILSKSYLPKVVRKGVASLTKAIELLSTRFFDGLVTATDDILKKFSYHHGKSVSVRNFPILSYFPSANKNNKESQNSRVFTLVYIGGLSKTRGVFEMVQSLQYITEPIKLTLCGQFYPGNFETTISKLKGFDRTEYLGWVEHKKVSQLLSECDVGMVCLHPIPNYLTALPVKLFEYMAAGLPVIASNFQLLREIVEGNRCGICVNPLNPRDIAKATEFFMKNPQTREEMGRNGRKAVLKMYNWDNESKKLIKLYQEVLKK